MATHTEDPSASQGAPQEEQKRVWYEWLAVTEGLTALVAVIALIVAIVAVGQAATNTTVIRSAPAPSSGSTPTAAAAPVSSVAPQSISMTYKSDTEHGRMGPDGQWHDAAVPANFTVHAGATVTVTALNYDDSPHTFTAPGLGANVTVLGGSAGSPAQTKFTFTAPSKPGKYLWRCTIPCDPWAMMHVGYMEGYVTVVA